MFKITSKMLDNLEYDNLTNDENKAFQLRSGGEYSSYTALFIFERSDIDAAIYYITKTFEEPCKLDGVRYIFVQESCINDFTAKLKSELRTFPKELVKNPTFCNYMQCVSKKLDKLNAETIQPKDCNDCIAPTIVINFSQEYFALPNGPAVLSLKTFRTSKEAFALCNQESNLKVASIWCENHAIAYELVQKLPFKKFYINCLGVSFEPLETIQKDQNKSASIIINSHHFEAVECNNELKYVVFPFGTTFAN